jgi:signal peptidase I/rubredoxin
MTEKTVSHRAPQEKKDRAAEVANTFEWLITAFILAFVFRAFVMEAFRIPTGSMADTLKGAHFRLRCRQCGYKYEYGYVPRVEDTIPAGGDDLPSTRCPSCGYWPPPAGTIMPVANGDRILVLKCIYQFLEPRRWDVIVFRNPLKPRINYIKRLIGRPGETVEIIDGDVYINGQISRKPPKVQDELWMPVYDNDYQPVNPHQLFFNSHKWQQPFNAAGSAWVVDKTHPTLFCLDSPADQVNTMAYDTSIGNDFGATYAYNRSDDYKNVPYCSDLMVRFYADGLNSPGLIGVELSKYQTRYKAWADFRDDSGKITMHIARVLEGKEQLLTDTSVEPQRAIKKSALVKLANVDHQLVFQFGDDRLTYDLGRGPEDAGQINLRITPQVKIFGSGKLTLSHVAILRDTYYTAAEFVRTGKPGWATQGNPFTLAEDEFFVLGDNSPNSEDGRLWDERGKANWGQSYRKGIVPRDYLVGKALFVYWPSGFRPFVRSRFAVVPNVGQMRFIYGGSNKSQ